MDIERQTAVVMPALNEASSIAQVVREVLHKTNCTVFVVDDFSQDATGAAAKASGAMVIRLATQLGAWGATQTGIRHAKQQGYKNVVTMDADGQHSADAISALLQPLAQGSADFSVGSCKGRGSAARHLAWWILRRFSGLRIDDLTSGLRAYNQEALRALSSRQASALEYQDVGVLVLLKSRGLVGVEIPVTMKERAIGRSKIFSNWSKVFFYMAYSALLSISKRGAKHRASRTAGASAGVQL